MTEEKPDPAAIEGVRQSADAPIPAQSRLPFFDPPPDDFPYYNGKPTGLSGAQWLILMAATALGFSLLLVPIPVLPVPLRQAASMILFPVVPMVALIVLTGGHWRALFRKFTPGHALWVLVFLVLNLIASIIVGLLVSSIYGAEANPAVSGLADMDTANRLKFFLLTIPQLFGEELVTILPFLALLTLGTSRLGMSRRNALIMAWVASAVLFGCLHLPTYGWNIVQCVLIIGTARIMLTLAYIKTKSITVSTLTHIANDWVIFSVGIIGGSAAVSA